ncbi:MAG TPA: hypothetical protein VE645_19045 [Pseudonocardiaceae bacterium]|nr:hypothetical protein [Pseudonocardiaceae bacterium]
MADTLDIYGKAEVAELLGLSRERVRQLQHGRRGKPPTGDFPKPDRMLACGPIWDGPRMRAYAAQRKGT